MINVKNKRVDLPVKEFVSQFPGQAQIYINEHFHSSETPYNVKTVLEYLLIAFDGYEEEKELKSLMRAWKKHSKDPSYVDEKLSYIECNDCSDYYLRKYEEEESTCPYCRSTNKHNQDED